MEQKKENLDLTMRNTNAAEEFLTEENEELDKIDDTKIFKLLGFNQQLQDIKDIKNEILNKQSEFVSDEEVIHQIDSAIKNIDINVLKSFKKEHVDLIYSINGKPIELDMKFENEEREFQFKKDFLIFRKESSDAIKEIDKSIEKLEKELSEDQEEIDKLLSQFGDFSSFIKYKLDESLKNAETPEKIKRIQDMMLNYDFGFNLNNIYYIYKNYKNINNIIKDYFDNKRAATLYKKYLTALKALKIKSDLTSFPDLEIKFLPEKYHKYPNLFLFTVLRDIAYNKDMIKRTTDGLFLSQLGYNIKCLYGNRFKDEETKQQFILNIQKVLDLFYQ
jgi:prefoldin subunit 5